MIKVIVAFEIDPDEYPVPGDGRVSESFKDDLKAIVAELDGVKVKRVRVDDEYFT